jgi:hypothetical protein
VNPAGQDHKKLAVQPINQLVLLIDAARPAPSQVLPQGLGFADANEGITQASLDQQVDAAAVQASRSIVGIGRIRINQPRGEELPTPGLLQRPLQMGRVGRGTQSCALAWAPPERW